MAAARSAHGTGVALTAGAAAAGWLAIVLVLNLTTNPYVAAGAFTGLAFLALGTLGGGRLLVIAIAVGLGMCVAVPGVGFADGSFRFAFASGTWARPSGGAEWIAALATTLRVPAQVLAVLLLARVPMSLLLAAVGRVSSRGALVAGLAVRLGPLLRRDVTQVRDELTARGVIVTRGGGAGERLRSGAALWNAMVSGVFDRAFTTAAALRTRGYGVALRPTTEPLRDPALRTEAIPARGVSAIVLAATTLAVVVALAARERGDLAPPSLLIFGGMNDPATPAAGAIALLMLVVGVAPLLGSALRSERPTRGNPSDTAARRVDPVPRPAQLDLDAVSVRHAGGAAPAIRDVSLRVEPGELLVLVGASGSGKTTLLDAITGVAPAVTGGERRGVIRLGHAVLGERPSPEYRVAAVFQVPEAQLVVGTVAEEVAFGPRHEGVAIGEVERRVRDALRTLRIEHLAHRECATLSGGELQRVLLAAALAVRPQVLVLDEPTSQLDAASAAAFWVAVDAARAAHGMSVVVAEHRLHDVLLHADRVLAVADGRVQAVDRASLTRDSVWGDLHPPAAVSRAVRLDVHIPRLAARGRDGVNLQRDLRFAVPAGSIVTVEGRNGTGKSTLLRTIRGLQPTDGLVRVDGAPPGSLARSARLFGWMSQSAAAYVPGSTVRDAATVVAERLGCSSVRAEAALRGAGFGARLDAHPATLSVGERQRLGFVAATSHDAPVWLLDEPTRGMDTGAKRWLASHLYEHARHGGVTVIATHDPAFAAAVATHRLLLDAQTGPHIVEVVRDAAGRPVMANVEQSAHEVSARGEVAP